jgi:hypothetical protein
MEESYDQSHEGNLLGPSRPCSNRRFSRKMLAMLRNQRPSLYEPCLGEGLRQACCNCCSVLATVRGGRRRQQASRLKLLSSYWTSAQSRSYDHHLTANVPVRHVVEHQDVSPTRPRNCFELDRLLLRPSTRNQGLLLKPSELGATMTNQLGSRSFDASTPRKL